MSKKLNLSGKVFGRLTVLDEAKERHQAGLVMWHCQCTCGEAVIVAGSILTRGRTKSCGCLQRDAVKELNKTSGTHRCSDTNIYWIWRGMHKRCKNKKDASYHRYGGRGISVCQRWDSFDNFLEDMGMPGEKLSIDRMDNDGNYEPGNCRWATVHEQANNRSSNVFVEFNGEVMTLKQVSVITGVNRMTLYWRYRKGWRLPELIREAKK